jgi:hypothetical protein
MANDNEGGIGGRSLQDPRDPDLRSRLPHHAVLDAGTTPSTPRKVAATPRAVSRRTDDGSRQEVDPQPPPPPPIAGEALEGAAAAEHPGISAPNTVRAYPAAAAPAATTDCRHDHPRAPFGTGACRHRGRRRQQRWRERAREGGGWRR